MLLKEEMLKLAGNKKKEVLTEGVRYFKFSNRIQKAIKRIEKSDSKIESTERDNLIEALEKAKKDFIKAEAKFEGGDEQKTEAKKLYEIAKAKHERLLKNVVVKKEMKSFILRAGLFGIIAGILVFLGVKNQDFLNEKFEKLAFNIESSSKSMLNELKYLGREKDAEYFDKKWSIIAKRSAKETADFAKELSKRTSGIASEAYKDFKSANNGK